MADYLTGHAEALADKLAVEHRTYKLGSGITSEYGHYVKSPGGAVTGNQNCRQFVPIRGFSPRRGFFPL